MDIKIYLEPSLDSLDRAGAVAGHALEEEQPGFLIQDGVGGPGQNVIGD